MAQTQNNIEPVVQNRLRDMAAELRVLLYGEAACPEWGTKFVKIEKAGMAVGLELARLLMEQSVQEQAEQMPAKALEVNGETATGARRHRRPLLTEAGELEWAEPLATLNRRSFFPSGSGIGD